MTFNSSFFQNFRQFRKYNILLKFELEFEKVNLYIYLGIQFKILWG